MKIMKKLILLLLHFYQRFISPLFPPSCRFYPTCSNYAVQAFQNYNFCKAFVLTFSRLLRCHPFCDGGFDPLPLPNNNNNNSK